MFFWKTNKQTILVCSLVGPTKSHQRQGQPCILSGLFLGVCLLKTVLQHSGACGSWSTMKQISKDRHPQKKAAMPLHMQVLQPITDIIKRQWGVGGFLQTRLKNLAFLRQARFPGGLWETPNYPSFWAGLFQNSSCQEHVLSYHFAVLHTTLMCSEKLSITLLAVQSRKFRPPPVSEMLGSASRCHKEG